jgi:ParB/RepB/Spo0J family partition protein
VVVVTTKDARFILIDGYKRVRVLRRLAQDTVRAVVWALAEVEALLLERLMRNQESEGALEQGWLLCELAARFHLSQDEMAQRFDKSKSWVSRRLALVAQLPESIQDRVRAGELSAHAAMKYLVPLARANRQEAERLAQAMAPLRLSTRQVGELYTGFLSADATTRDRMVENPWLYLRAQSETRSPTEERSAAIRFLHDLEVLGGIARRAHRKLGDGSWHLWSSKERDEILGAQKQAEVDTQALFRRLEKEVTRAGPESKNGDFATASEGTRQSGDCPSAQSLTPSGA